MRIQYLGHSCFLVSSHGGEKILFDPFISPNERAKGKVAVADLRPDYIFLSHAHFDHIADAEVIAKQADAPIIGVWEIHAHFEEKKCRTHPMNVGGTWRSPRQGSDLWVKLVPAVHTSSFPGGAYGGVPVGFVFSDGKHTLYYAGDTALTLEMELVAERYALDLAFLPIGGTFTMDIEDAVEAALLLDVSHVIGMHYDTFPPIEIDKAKAQAAFSENDVHLHLLEIGETIDLAQLLAQTTSSPTEV
ncbi:MAG: metal-dependent hydrolase [Bacteroidia bacterium]|nr:metal-dependent hydrolase [Bacteroidia bacterium]